jgi:hypothetical protein
MTASVCAKFAVLITFILGCGLLLMPYPAMRQLINDRNLATYNCSEARNFTYGGKTRGAYRATAIANLTLPETSARVWRQIGTEQQDNINSSTDTKDTTQSVIVKLHYPGLSTWLPYSYNSRADTVSWFSGLSSSSQFQCVANVGGEWGYTRPALPNLPIYYASCAGGVIFIFMSGFICYMDSRRQRRVSYDYTYIN